MAPLQVSKTVVRTPCLCSVMTAGAIKIFHSRDGHPSLSSDPEDVSLVLTKSKSSWGLRVGIVSVLIASLLYRINLILTTVGYVLFKNRILGPCMSFKYCKLSVFSCFVYFTYFLYSKNRRYSLL